MPSKKMALLDNYKAGWGRQYLIDNFVLPSDSDGENVCRNGHVLSCYFENYQNQSQTLRSINSRFGLNEKYQQVANLIRKVKGLIFASSTDTSRRQHYKDICNELFVKPPAAVDDVQGSSFPTSSDACPSDATAAASSVNEPEQPITEVAALGPSDPVQGLPASTQPDPEAPTDDARWRGLRDGSKMTPREEALKQRLQKVSKSYAILKECQKKRMKALREKILIKSDCPRKLKIARITLKRKDATIQKLKEKLYQNPYRKKARIRQVKIYHLESKARKKEQVAEEKLKAKNALIKEKDAEIHELQNKLLLTQEWLLEMEEEEERREKAEQQEAKKSRWGKNTKTERAGKKPGEDGEIPGNGTNAGDGKTPGARKKPSKWVKNKGIRPVHLSRVKLAVEECLKHDVPQENVHSLVTLMTKRLGFRLTPLADKRAIEGMVRELIRSQVTLSHGGCAETSKRKRDVNEPQDGGCHKKKKRRSGGVMDVTQDVGGGCSGEMPARVNGNEGDLERSSGTHGQCLVSDTARGSQRQESRDSDVAETQGEVDHSGDEGDDRSGDESIEGDNFDDSIIEGDEYGDGIGGDDDGDDVIEGDDYVDDITEGDDYSDDLEGDDYGDDIEGDDDGDDIEGDDDGDVVIIERDDHSGYCRVEGEQSRMQGEGKRSSVQTQGVASGGQLTEGRTRTQVAAVENQETGIFNTEMEDDILVVLS